MPHVFKYYNSIRFGQVTGMVLHEGDAANAIGRIGVTGATGGIVRCEKPIEHRYILFSFHVRYYCYHIILSVYNIYSLFINLCLMFMLPSFKISRSSNEAKLMPKFGRSQVLSFSLALILSAE